MLPTARTFGSRRWLVAVLAGREEQGRQHIWHGIHSLSSGRPPPHIAHHLEKLCIGSGTVSIVTGRVCHALLGAAGA
eukprot:8897707-Pyramimonas_sp.AAC.1